MSGMCTGCCFVSCLLYSLQVTSCTSSWGSRCTLCIAELSPGQQEASRRGVRPDNSVPPMFLSSVVCSASVCAYVCVVLLPCFLWSHFAQCFIRSHQLKTSMEAVGRSSVPTSARRYPCFLVHSSWTPSRLSPSAGLLRLSTQSIHILQPSES